MVQSMTRMDGLANPILHDNRTKIDRLGLISSAPYNYAEIDDLVARDARQMSEFHALPRYENFDLLDTSGGARDRASASNLFAHPLAALKAGREAAGLRALLAIGDNDAIQAFPALSAVGVRVPMVFIVHGGYFDNPKFKMLMAVLARLRHIYFLGMSKAVTKELLRRFPVDPERCAVGAQGVDTDFFRPMPMVGDGVISSAGVAQRDYPTLFSATHDLPVTVELATNSAWSASASFAAPVPANVVAGDLPMFTGLRDLYARSRFVVAPLNPAPFACGYSVIAEAMAMGKAVIASRNVGRSDLIVPEETGIYVECGDVAGMRAAISRLLADPDEARRMGEAGRRRIVEIGSMPVYAATIRTRVEAFVEHYESARAVRTSSARTDTGSARPTPNV